METYNKEFLKKFTKFVIENESKKDKDEIKRLNERIEMYELNKSFKEEQSNSNVKNNDEEIFIKILGDING